MLFIDVLVQVGDNGSFQRRLVFLFFIPVIIIFGINTFGTLFMVYTPDHWCHVPELENLSIDLQHRLIRPLKFKHGKEEYESCYMYDIDYVQVSESLELPSNDTDTLPTKKCSNGWAYDRSQFIETAVTKVSLIYQL